AELALKAHVLRSDPEILAEIAEGDRLMREIADAVDLTEAPEDAVAINRAQQHRSHGLRIDRDDARGQDLKIEELEADAVLQDIVLTNYHIATLIFEKSRAVKFIASDNAQLWVKNLGPVAIP